MTNSLYRLTETAYQGHKFAHPEHTWTRGEITLSLRFSHPYTASETDGRLTIKTHDGDHQVWLAMS